MFSFRFAAPSEIVVQTMQQYVRGEVGARPVKINVTLREQIHLGLASATSKLIPTPNVIQFFT